MRTTSLIKRLKYSLATLLFLLTSATGSVSPLLSAHASANPEQKVFVCKYVGKPNVDERLQTGNNPISVSANATHENPVSIGSYFADAQGQSYVLAWDFGQPDPNVSQCPAGRSATVIPVPAVPTQTDPCGLNNAAWNMPSDTTSLDWSLSFSGDLTVKTKTGYVFTDGTTSHDYGYATDSNVSCAQKISIPQTPSATDPCGLNNAIWNVPSNTSSIIWTATNGDLVATTKPGYIFTDGTTSHDYGYAHDSNASCRISIPATPSVNDPCGLGNAAWVQPADSTTITWTVTNGHLIAHTTAGNLFTDSMTTQDYGTVYDSGKLCVVDVPATPAVDDACGPNNATWIKPADSASVTWAIGQNKHLVATASKDYVFSDGYKTHDYGVAPDSGVQCEKFVYVCKYVGTPGVNERLQTGQNPIRVSVNAIQHNQWDGTTMPAWFSDAQDRSYVLAFDNGQPAPTSAACPTIVIDVCTNISGIQPQLPDGYTLKDGKCVKCPIPLDVCTNLPGFQKYVPRGYKLEDGKCVKDCPKPPVDVCTNLHGLQSKVPEGYELKDGKCVKCTPPPVDVCKNIPENQPALPEGMTIDNESNCVAIQPQTQEITPGEVTFVDATCVTSGTYTVPVTDGVIYEDADGHVVPAGTYNALPGQTVTITAHLASSPSIFAVLAVSNPLVLTGTTSWMHTFVAATNCGHVLGDTTSTDTPTTGGKGAVLADTGTSTVLPTILAISLSLTATGIMFGSNMLRKRATSNSL